MKRLFFDIETSPCVGYFWRPGYRVRLTYDNVIEDAKVICISYKWEGQDEVYSLVWEDQDDKKVIRDFVKVMGKADEIIAHNGDRFDVPWIRTRALKHGITSVPRYHTLDTLKSVRGNFKLPSNRLGDIAKYLGLKVQKMDTSFDLWKRVMAGEEKALDYMVEYCEYDVFVLEEVYHKIQKLVPHKVHAGVVDGGPKWSCPNCGSKKVVRNGTHTTTTGQQKQKMTCRGCKKSYRITTLQYSKFLEYRLKHGKKEV
jgi:DNA polymerase elongation subunit (family B)